MLIICAPFILPVVSLFPRTWLTMACAIGLGIVFLGIGAISGLSSINAGPDATIGWGAFGSVIYSWLAVLSFFAAAYVTTWRLLKLKWRDEKWQLVHFWFWYLLPYSPILFLLVE